MLALSNAYNDHAWLLFSRAFGRLTEAEVNPTQAQ